MKKEHGSVIITQKKVVMIYGIVSNVIERGKTNETMDTPSLVLPKGCSQKRIHDGYGRDKVSL